MQWSRSSVVYHYKCSSCKYPVQFLRQNITLKSRDPSNKLPAALTLHPRTFYTTRVLLKVVWSFLFLVFALLLSYAVSLLFSLASYRFLLIKTHYHICSLLINNGNKNWMSFYLTLYCFIVNYVPFQSWWGLVNEPKRRWKKCSWQRCSVHPTYPLLNTSQVDLRYLYCSWWRLIADVYCGWSTQQRKGEELYRPSRLPGIMISKTTMGTFSGFPELPTLKK